MIYLTGDKHVPIDISWLNSKNFPQGKNLSKSDYLIILGDFGLVWNQRGEDTEERFWKQWLNAKGWTTLFIDGNHENFDRLLQYPQEELFGGRVSRISDSIFWLRRGEFYNIDGNRFFTFGGGLSIDKAQRTAHYSWWEQEIPNEQEFEKLLDFACSYEEVDYILTHVPPASLAPHRDNADPVSRQLENIRANRKIYKHWYFGHIHEDRTLDSRHTVLYNSVIQLGETVEG